MADNITKKNAVASILSGTLAPIVFFGYILYVFITMKFNNHYISPASLFTFFSNPLSQLFFAVSFYCCGFSLRYARRYIKSGDSEYLQKIKTIKISNIIILILLAGYVVLLFSPLKEIYIV